MLDPPPILNPVQTHQLDGLPDKTKASNQLNEAMKIFTELDAKADIKNTQASLDRIAKSVKESTPKRSFTRINQRMV